MNRFIGIDPGLTGAMGVLDESGAFVGVYDMPIEARGNGRVKHQVSGRGLADIVQALRARGEGLRALVEQVSAMPGQGVASVFSLGHSLGVICGVLEAQLVPYELVTPASWKKQMAVTANKDLALATARRLWPAAPLNLKKHDGRAEALLMAEFARKRAQL